MVISFKVLNFRIGDTVAGSLGDFCCSISFFGSSRIRIDPDILFLLRVLCAFSFCAVSKRALHPGCRGNGRKESCHGFLLVLLLRCLLCSGILIPKEIADHRYRINRCSALDLCKINAGNLRGQIFQMSRIRDCHNCLGNSESKEVFLRFHRVEQAVDANRLGDILPAFITVKRNRDLDVLARNKLRIPTIFSRSRT